MATKTYSKTNRIGAYGHQWLWAQCSGADTPRALREQGIFLENSYTARYKTEYNGPVNWTLFPGANLDSSMTGLSLNGSFPTSPPALSQMKAYSNLLEKFKQSDFNLAVSAGESRESWHMISDRMFKIADGARHVRRGQLGDAMRAFSSTKRPSRRAQRKLDTGDVSGSFLELSYGWVPLMSDIFAAAEVIDKPYVSKPSIRTSDKSSAGPFTNLRPSYQNYTYTEKNERKVYHIVRLSEKEASWAVRLGLTDPLSVAWELVPLSFVVDWFLPISDLLSALQATYVLPVGKYVRTDCIKQIGGVLIPAGTPIDFYYAESKMNSTGIYRWNETYMTRQVYEELPTDLYLDSGPRQSLIDLDMNLFQALSSSALLHQRLQSLMKRRS